MWRKESLEDSIQKGFDATIPNFLKSKKEGKACEAPNLRPEKGRNGIALTNEQWGHH